MNSLNKILVVLLFIGGVVSCSKLQEPITPSPDLTIHDDGNIDPASPNFHGLIIAESKNGWSDCRQCHASDLSGGTAQVGCNRADCHPTFNVHLEGIIDTTSQDFHGKFIRMINWDILDCMKCHGDDYSGGVASPTCNNCHSQPGGPEACNTCHGNFADGNFIAPPKDIYGNTSTNDPGVGAHQIHLFDNDLSSSIECTTCHIIPQNYSDPGHVDSTPPAELIFNNKAILNIALNPVYDHSSATCSDTYCHGNFEYLKDDAPENHKFAYEEGADRISGNNHSVIWNNVDGSQAVCGSCHNLPPIGHVEANVTACGYCHSGISDTNGNLVDSLIYKHMDGKIDLIF